jgi:predicted aspartyl protease
MREATAMRGVALGLAGALALLATVGGARAQATQPAAAAPADAPETLKLVQDPSQRLTLQVMVNGRGPFDFLVDTGSARTLISRELAATLQLPPGSKVRIREMAGANDSGTVIIDSLAIGNRVMRHVEAPALAAENIGAAGMLGVDAMRDLHVVMDFKAMHLSSSPSRAEAVDPRTIVVHGKNRLGELILSHSRVRGVPILVVVDSGSEVSIGNEALLRLLTKRSLSLDPPQKTQLVDVTGRRVILEQDQIAEADVGGLVIHNMPLAFADLPIFGYLGLADTPALFLGMDVLSQCERVSVDVRRREATFTLKAPEDVSAPG